MNYVLVDNNNNKKYIITLILLYLPLITFNIMTYITLIEIKDNITNLLNNQEDAKYVSKIKYLVDYVCGIVKC